MPPVGRDRELGEITRLLEHCGAPPNVLRIHGEPGGVTTRRVACRADKTVRTSFTLEALRVGRVPMTVFASTNGFPSKGLVLYIDPK
jgi:hypothetical protein